MTESLLVYDGSNRLFRTAVESFVEPIEGLRAVRWDAEPVQRFLEAQFGDRPFVFLLVEDDTVHVGAETVRRVLERRGVAGPVAELFGEVYPATAAPVGRLVHGEVPPDRHGSEPLDEAAGEHLAPLRRSVEITVEAEDQ
jgi:hypothetical protein